MSLHIPNWLYNRQIDAYKAYLKDREAKRYDELRDFYSTCPDNWREFFQIDGSAEMKDHEERVLTERDDLVDKIEKLTVFMNGEKMKGIPGREKSRMGRQLSAMCQYRDILNERISQFPPDPDEFIYAKLWFKCNYLEMFLRKQWLKGFWIESVTRERDGKRFEVFCKVERKHLEDIKPYLSSTAVTNFDDPNVYGSRGMAPD